MNNPSHHYMLEKSFSEKKKPNQLAMTQYVAKKDISLHSQKVKRSNPFSLPSTEETQPQCCVKCCAQKKEKGLLKQAQQKVMKMTKGLEHLTYEERMKETALFRQEKESKGVVLLFFFPIRMYT